MKINNQNIIEPSPVNLTVAEENFNLGILQAGNLESLKLQSIRRQQPGVGEVEIKVAASGLNFKEVLFALGLIPYPPELELKFGLECSGTIVALGEGVEGFALGDEVIAFGSSCLSKFITISKELVTLKPSHLSLEAAATIPVAFMTAYYALIKLGNLSQGDRILIHSASGGVGLAAVQIAQWQGAEIFATAGNIEKQDFLRSLGIKYVMNSRSLDFAEEVRQYTNGKGVDLVLNSLGGEFIPKSLELLSPYGRFLELGRRDILNNNQLGLLAFAKNISFSAINVEPEDSIFKNIWQEIIDHFQAGNFTSLTHCVFPINSIQNAFEYMSEAKHIGKIIISLTGKTAPRTSPVSVSNLGEQGLLPLEGVEIFSRILANSLPQVLISTENLLNRVDRADVLAEMPEAIASENKLSKQTHSRPELNSVYVAPRNEIEQKITGIWQEYLGIEPIGINDDFFELGGHSLLATRLMSKLSSVLGVELLLSQLFDSPTVASLATSIDTGSSQIEEKSADATNLPALISAPEQRDLPFPLTEVQQAYWIGRRGDLELGNISTHFYGEIDSVDLDLDRYSMAWQKMIERHEMLRAVVLRDGQQQILDRVPPYQIQTQDLRDKDPKEVEVALEEMRDRLDHQVLSSDRWPLFEICASLLDGGKIRLHLSFDALIIDLRSIEHIWRELAEVYQNPDLKLEPNEISFRDYVLAQQKLPETDIYQRSLDYWLSRLPQIFPAPELPMVQNLAATTQPKFKRRSTQLKPKVWQTLKERAKKSNLTPSGLLLAAFAEILTVWSKRSQFTLNLTLFNRLPLHPQVDRVVGDFTSVTLLSVDNSQVKSFLVRAQQLQKQLWQDLDRSYVSGVEVLRELNRLHENTSTFMPVVFTSNLVSQVGVEQTSGMSKFGELVYAVSQTPQVLFDHQVYEEAGSLILNWDTVDEVFPAGMLDKMFAVYADFLELLATDESAWQTTKRPFNIPTSALSATNTINIAGSELLHTGFTRHVLQQPDRLAVVTASRNFTYKELDRQINRVGHRLRNLGATPNQLIAVVMEKGWEQVVAVLGILSAGAAYLPIDPDLPTDRIAYLLENSQALLVLTQSWLADRIAIATETQVICLDNEELASESDLPLAAVQKPTDLAYVIYTSGSTGMPKGVAIEHQGAVNTILDINRRFKISNQDRVLAISDLNFDLSVYDIFGTLTAGGIIVIPDAQKAKEPAHWAELMMRDRVTIWNSVPALMQLCVDYVTQKPELYPPALRLVLLSGDWLPPALPDRLKALKAGVKVISLGGATEASIWSIIYPIEEVDPAWNSIPYGRAMQNQSFYVLDEKLEVRPTWVSGQLYIGGIGLARGYWQNSEKTEASFITHPETGDRLYRTGDLGRYLPDGNIEFLGREDFQVKIRGYRIELGEIEAVLEKHQAVKTAVVIAAGEQQNKHLIAYIVSDRELRSEQLQNHLREQLPEYMLPSSFAWLDSLPLTANGKVNRRLLLDTVEIKPKPTRYIAPSNQIEEMLAEIWQELLCLDRVSIKDSFFTLGGNSLLAIKLITQLQETLQIEFSLRQFFDAVTIEKLAIVLEEILLQEVEVDLDSLSEAEKHSLSLNN